MQAHMHVHARNNNILTRTAAKTHSMQVHKLYHIPKKRKRGQDCFVVTIVVLSYCFAFIMPPHANAILLFSVSLSP